MKKLSEISSKANIEKFINLNNKKIKFYNEQFLSEISNKDRGLYKGLGLYIYDEQYLANRSNYIQKRLEGLLKKNLILKKIFLRKNKIKLTYY